MQYASFMDSSASTSSLVRVQWARHQAANGFAPLLSEPDSEAHHSSVLAQGAIRFAVWVGESKA